MTKVRALLLLASLMVLSGAFALVNGAGMILNERGWSQVIAGSVVLTGGFIIAALAVVVAEMQKSGAGRIVSSDHAPTDAAHSQSDFTAPASFSSPVADGHITVPHGPMQSAVASVSDQHHFQPEGQVAPFTASVPLHAGQQDSIAAALAHETVVAPPASDYTQISPVVPATVLNETVSFAPEPVLPLHEAPSARPQLKQPSLFEIVQESSKPHDLLSGLPLPQGVSAPPNMAVSAPIAASPIAAPNTPAAERVLLASYSTGGVGYFMYSDQSIEAEMAIGRYRFGSMDELRRFIETQEGGEKVVG